MKYIIIMSVCSIVLLVYFWLTTRKTLLRERGLNTELRTAYANEKRKNLELLEAIGCMEHSAYVIFMATGYSGMADWADNIHKIRIKHEKGLEDDRFRG